MTGIPGHPLTSAFLPGAPLTMLRDQVNAELAAGTISCACPHPENADSMTLPGKIFGCRDCVLVLTQATDACQPPACSCCGTKVATGVTGWVTPGSVIVLASVCAACQKAGNAPMSPN